MRDFTKTPAMQKWYNREHFSLITREEILNSAELCVLEIISEPQWAVLNSCLEMEL